jgi:ketosteroid isomerase-like protein
MSRKNIEIVKRLYAAFDSDDSDSSGNGLDAILGLLAEDVDWEFQGPEAIPYAGSYHGREAVARFFAMIPEYVEALEFNVRQYLADGDVVIALGDEKMRVKSTGKTFEMEWADIYTFKKGRIVRFREYTDTGAILLAYQVDSRKSP